VLYLKKKKNMYSLEFIPQFSITKRRWSCDYYIKCGYNTGIQFFMLKLIILIIDENTDENKFI